MAYTFLKAQGKQIGNSKLEKDKIDIAKGILEKAKKMKVKIFLPQDNVVTDKIEAGSQVKTVGEDIPDGWIGVDIGPKTIREYCQTLKKPRLLSGTGLWGFLSGMSSALAPGRWRN